ncbi:hypothetical protein [Burkholderia sp. Bp8963]|uniref:hypothetical protein n=1 Tax=Burkholderia sp. Bp8963 TaxID=2184547 RepID=UPI0021AB5C03|nr:hypothetical protein [Burkholderia sp. Bp8963]
MNHSTGLFGSFVAPAATCSPPGTSPFGTVDGSAAAAAAAPCCAAICAATACAACPRLRIDGWLACSACCGDTPRFGTPGTPPTPPAPPPDARAVACPRFMIPAACACAGTTAASINAIA